MAIDAKLKTQYRTLIKQTQGESPELDFPAAAVRFLQSPMGRMPGAKEAVAELVRDHHAAVRQEEERRRKKVLVPPGSSEGWYAGPQPDGRYWAPLETAMRSGKMADAADSIDEESTNVVASLASPFSPGSRAKGLVVGYVQSGKTANYSAVMAKAADEGYRLIIVLAGMFENLRRQTQKRLEQDVMQLDTRHEWLRLTEVDEDFAKQKLADVFIRGAQTPLVVVVKKNSTRLKYLCDFLKKIDDSLLRKTPTLIIDDESDQATPNTKADKEEFSKINDLVRGIWAQIETGSYVAYTATPFANVLMSPDDSAELYPSDFIYPLPRPEGYFGAGRIFGTHPQFLKDDGGESGLDVVRVVPPEEVEVITPPTKKEEHGDYCPALVPSWRNAVLWFIMSTAIRYARGQSDKHASMLVHTTHFTEPHFAQQSVLRKYVGDLRQRFQRGDLIDLKKSYDSEAQRVAEEFANPSISWDEAVEKLPLVLERLDVIVDNGESLERLAYPDDSPQVLIVVGGSTLSRGLTLEGLSVSHFVRRSRAYDTLLQMGRWFGYRHGYEDLVRVWTTAELSEDYRYLAGVEEEIRERIAEMREAGESPASVGIAVRAHPGTLEITARNKMYFADELMLALGGTRMQTTIFDVKKADALSCNLEAAKDLVSRSAIDGAEQHVHPKNGSVLFEGVPAGIVEEFLRRYEVHPEHTSLQPGQTLPWIQEHGAGTKWNVVLRSFSGDESVRGRGTPVDMGSGVVVTTTSRTPMCNQKDKDNIRALMPESDLIIDQLIKIRSSAAEAPDTMPASTKDMKQCRFEVWGNHPLLVVYVIDKDSVPMDKQKQDKSRRALQAPEHVIALGIVFHKVGTKDAVYVGVTPTLPEDSEGESPILESAFEPELAGANGDEG